MATNSVIKKTARSALKDNWCEAIAAGSILIFAELVLYIAVSLFSMVVGNVVSTVILVVFTLFITLPLLLGVFRCYWLIMWDKKSVVGEVFYYFSSGENYIKTVKLFGSLFLKALGIGAILIIPSIITDILSLAKIYEFFQFSAPSWSSNLALVSVFLKVVAGVILLIIMLKYYLAPFLIIADEEMDVQEAIHKSTVLAKASLIDFITLTLSFAGYIILSVFVVPLIFTLPYFMVSYMVHSRFSVANYNKVVKRLGINEEQSYYTNEGF